MEREALRFGASACTLTGDEKRKPEGMYEWFLGLPVPVVLGVLWLVGVGLIASVVGVLYLFGASLLTLVRT